MKFRTVLLVLLFSLALTVTACSSTAGIAQISGSQAHDAAPVALDATSTPQVSPTPETSPAVTGEATPSPETSPTPLPAVVVIDGTLTIPSGVQLPDGTNATLLIYNNATQQVEQTLETPVNADGTYEFTDIPATTDSIYLVTVDYGGVTYNSSPVAFDGTTFLLNLPVTLYATSDDLNLLSISQTHLQFDFSTTGSVQVMALYVISNPGDTTVIVPTDGTSIPFIQTPEGAQNVSFQSVPNASPLLRSTNGFALAPGSDKQYGIYASFTLPYTGRLVYTQPYTLPVSAATVIVPEGVKVRSDQLTDAGTQDSSGTTYHLWQGNSLASGSTLTLTISGMPGDKPGFVLDQKTMIMIGVGAVGLILIGLGIFLFLRERKLRKMEDEFEQADDLDDEPGPSLETKDNILDAIIALEDKFKAGEITREAFEKRKDELKAQLAGLV